MEFPNIDPIALQIGPLAIRWYALAYITGLLLGWRYSLYLTKFPPNAVSRAALDEYDRTFEIPYPLPKSDMVAIPEFAAGAMENWGLVTYREVDLLIDDATASSRQLQRVAEVVIHELAHQWFGNLVTMEWWDDLWLNEGFATWMETGVCARLYPEWSM